MPAPNNTAPYTASSYKTVRCGSLIFRMPVQTERYYLERSRQAWNRQNKKLLVIDASAVVTAFVIFMLKNAVAKNNDNSFVFFGLISLISVFLTVALIRYAMGMTMRSDPLNAVLSGVALEKRHIGINPQRLAVLIKINDSDMTAWVRCCKDDYDSIFTGCNVLLIKYGKNKYAACPVEY